MGMNECAYRETNLHKPYLPSSRGVPGTILDWSILQLLPSRSVGGRVLGAFKASVSLKRWLCVLANSPGFF